MEHDPWPPHLADLPDAQRLVTVRDGAIWIEIDRRGAIAAGSFLNETD